MSTTERPRVWDWGEFSEYAQFWEVGFYFQWQREKRFSRTDVVFVWYLLLLCLLLLLLFHRDAAVLTKCCPTRTLAMLFGARAKSCPRSVWVLITELWTARISSEYYSECSSFQTTEHMREIFQHPCKALFILFRNGPLFLWVIDSGRNGRL